MTLFTDEQWEVNWQYLTKESDQPPPLLKTLDNEAYTIAFFQTIPESWLTRTNERRLYTFLKSNDADGFSRLIKHPKALEAYMARLSSAIIKDAVHALTTQLHIAPFSSWELLHQYGNTLNKLSTFNTLPSNWPEEDYIALLRMLISYTTFRYDGEFAEATMVVLDKALKAYPSFSNNLMASWANVLSTRNTHEDSCFNIGLRSTLYPSLLAALETAGPNHPERIRTLLESLQAYSGSERKGISPKINPASIFNLFPKDWFERNKKFLFRSLSETFNGSPSALEFLFKNSPNELINVFGAEWIKNNYTLFWETFIQYRDMLLHNPLLWRKEIGLTLLTALQCAPHTFFHDDKRSTELVSFLCAKPTKYANSLLIHLVTVPGGLTHIFSCFAPNNIETSSLAIFKTLSMQSKTSASVAEMGSQNHHLPAEVLSFLLKSPSTLTNLVWPSICESSTLFAAYAPALGNSMASAILNNQAPSASLAGLIRTLSSTTLEASPEHVLLDLFHCAVNDKISLPSEQALKLLRAYLKKNQRSIPEAQWSEIWTALNKTNLNDATPLSRLLSNTEDTLLLLKQMPDNIRDKHWQEIMDHLYRQAEASPTIDNLFSDEKTLTAFIDLIPKKDMDQTMIRLLGLSHYKNFAQLLARRSWHTLYATAQNEPAYFWRRNTILRLASQQPTQSLIDTLTYLMGVTQDLLHRGAINKSQLKRYFDEENSNGETTLNIIANLDLQEEKDPIPTVDEALLIDFSKASINDTDVIVMPPPAFMNMLDDFVDHSEEDITDAYRATGNKKLKVH